MKKKKNFTILWFFRKTTYFEKSCFYHEMSGLNNFGFDLGVSINNEMIFIYKYLANSLRFSSNELLKATTILTHNILWNFQIHIQYHLNFSSPIQKGISCRHWLSAVVIVVVVVGVVVVDVVVVVVVVVVVAVVVPAIWRWLAVACNV